MKLIEFPEQTVVIAKDQPEYYGMPAHCFRANPEEGRIACCWRLSWWERLTLLATGRIWHQILTFNHPLQPQLLTVEKPDMPMPLKPKGRCLHGKTVNLGAWHWCEFCGAVKPASTDEQAVGWCQPNLAQREEA
jgi:hypothetical protein